MYIVKLEVHKEGAIFSVAAHDGDLMGLYVFSPEHIDEDEGKKKKKGKK